MAKEKSNKNIYLLAIVAIVAVVGIVVLILNSGTELTSVSEEDLAGQAIVGQSMDDEMTPRYTTTKEIVDVKTGGSGCVEGCCPSSCKKGALASKK